MNALPTLTPPPVVIYFQWWHKGRTPEGATVSLRGHVPAASASDAMREVDAMLRAKFPAVRWMHGREMDTETTSYGPTVQKMRGVPRSVKPGPGPQIQTQTLTTKV